MIHPDLRTLAANLLNSPIVKGMRASIRDEAQRRRRPDPYAALEQALLASRLEAGAARATCQHGQPSGCGLCHGSMKWAQEPAGEAPTKQACDALRFAAGAIYDAIGLDDGLDGRAGEAVLSLIDAALVANGQTPMARPTDDSDSTRWYADYLRERLAALEPAGEAPAPAEDARELEGET